MLGGDSAYDYNKTGYIEYPVEVSTGTDFYKQLNVFKLVLEVDNRSNSHQNSKTE